MKIAGRGVLAVTNGLSRLHAGRHLPVAVLGLGGSNCALLGSPESPSLVEARIHVFKPLWRHVRCFGHERAFCVLVAQGTNWVVVWVMA